MGFADQSGFAVRFEWGVPGLQAAAAGAAVIVVDVLSFTTSVSVACNRGAVIYPCEWDEERAAELAARRGARLAVRRGSDAEAAGGFSLSPESLLAATPDLRVVLPSLNGSVLTHAALQEPRPIAAGCLRNASAVAAWAMRQSSPVCVVAAGECWPDGTLRFSLEDLLGAGAIIAHLRGERSPEAEGAAAAFTQAAPRLLATLRSCSSGRELVQRGYDADVALAADLDADHAAPVIVDGGFRCA